MSAFPGRQRPPLRRATTRRRRAGGSDRVSANQRFRPSGSLEVRSALGRSGAAGDCSETVGLSAASAGSPVPEARSGPRVASCQSSAQTRASTATPRVHQSYTFRCRTPAGQPRQGRRSLTGHQTPAGLDSGSSRTDRLGRCPRVAISLAQAESLQELIDSFGRTSTTFRSLSMIRA